MQRNNQEHETRVLRLILEQLNRHPDREEVSLVKDELSRIIHNEEKVDIGYLRTKATNPFLRQLSNPKEYDEPFQRAMLSLLLLLAKYFPNNNDMECPIGFEPIEETTRLLMTSGHQFNTNPEIFERIEKTKRHLLYNQILTPIEYDYVYSRKQVIESGEPSAPEIPDPTESLSSNSPLPSNQLVVPRNDAAVIDHKKILIWTLGIVIGLVASAAVTLLIMADGTVGFGDAFGSVGSLTLLSVSAISIFCFSRCARQHGNSAPQRAPTRRLETHEQTPSINPDLAAALFAQLMILSTAPRKEARIEVLEEEPELNLEEAKTAQPNSTTMIHASLGSRASQPAVPFSINSNHQNNGSENNNPAHDYHLMIDLPNPENVLSYSPPSPSR